MEKRIAVVTGGNRGIGLEACRQLARAGLKVILTARDKAKGEEAADGLKKEGLDVSAAALDVSSPESIRAFADQMNREYGRVDVLVNNAGVLIDQGWQGTKGSPSIFAARLEDIRATMDTNVYGVLLLIQAFAPGMRERQYGRIVNLSSGMGQLSDMGGGYPAYRLSKVALNGLTRIAAAELAGSNVLVNTMCPGWVRTEMGGPNATRTVEEGADTITWLAMLPDGGPSGKFFRDRKEIPW